MMTCVQPADVNIEPDTSPVNAPLSSQCMFCAESKTRLPATHAATGASAGKGGATRTSRSLTSYAWLSTAAAFATMALKLVAWMMTGSVGLLSDALESLVNVGGATMALLMLHWAAAPPE